MHLVINRVRSENDVQKVRDHPGDHANLFSEQFVIPHEERMLECAPDTELLLNEDTPFTESIRKIRAALKLYGVKEWGDVVASINSHIYFFLC
ncbi:MAG: hypothetical protein JXA08_08640 [Methanomicrobiaceae archaeon]|nr:hypothetical protein [Methanomicrobiaceae archaeon]